MCFTSSCTRVHEPVPSWSGNRAELSQMHDGAQSSSAQPWNPEPWFFYFFVSWFALQGSTVLPLSRNLAGSILSFSFLFFFSLQKMTANTLHGDNMEAKEMGKMDFLKKVFMMQCISSSSSCDFNNAQTMTEIYHVSSGSYANKKFKQRLFCVYFEPYGC